MAAANGHADAIRLLLSKSADPSPKTKEGGNTPLHWACLNGHAAATTALLEGGALRGEVAGHGGLLLLA